MILSGLCKILPSTLKTYQDFLELVKAPMRLLQALLNLSEALQGSSETPYDLSGLGITFSNLFEPSQDLIGTCYDC